MGAQVRGAITGDARGLSKATNDAERIVDNMDLSKGANRAAGAFTKVGDGLDHAGRRGTQSLAGLGQHTDWLTGKVQDFGARSPGAFGAVSGGVTDLLGQFTTMGSGAALATAGVVTGVGAVAAAVAAAAVGAYKLGAEFDDAYDRIQIGTGETGAELDSLQQSFRSVVTSLPVGFDEAATVITKLNQRLDQSGAPLEKLSRQLLNLSRLTGTDLASNTDAAIDVFQRWNVPTERQSLLLDKLKVASEHSGASVTELTSSLAGSAFAFQEQGMSIDQAIAQIAVWQKQGLDVDKMLTTQSRALMKLSKLHGDLGEDEGKSAAAAQSAARQRRSALESIERAQENVQRAQERLNQANADYQRVMSIDVESAREDGRRKLADATRAVADAQEQVIDAKQRLDLLLKGPSEKDVQRQRIDSERAALGVASAEQSLADATEAVQAARQAGDQDELNRALIAQQQAQLSLKQAQMDSAEEQENLNNLLGWTAEKSKEVADARDDVANAERAVADANQRVTDTQQQLTDQLGPALDGAPMLAAAYERVAEAQRSVDDANRNVAQSQRALTESAQSSASALADLDAPSATTRQVLKDLGLEGATVAEQFSGLQGWLAANKDSTEALAVASDLYGKGAPEMMLALSGQATGAGDLETALVNALGAIERTAQGTDDGTEKMSKAWNQFKVQVEPVATWVFDFAGRWIDGVARMADKTYEGAQRMGEMFNSLTSTAYSAVVGIAEAWNSLDLSIGPWTIPGWVPPPFGGKTFHIPDVFPDVAVPRMAEGGIVSARSGGILATIGEGRYDEAVVPLKPGMGFGGTTVLRQELHFHGPVAQDSVRWVVDQIQMAKRRGMKVAG